MVSCFLFYLKTFHQPHERHAVTKVVDIQNEIDLPNLDNSISNADQNSGICGATLPYSRSCQRSYSRSKLPKNAAVFSGTLHKQSSQVYNVFIIHVYFDVHII